MKRKIILIISLLAVLLLVACTSSKNNKEFKSEVYTDEEIREAMKIVEKNFKNNCFENLKLYYKGDDKSKWEEILKNNRGEKAIVIHSSYNIGKTITKECETLLADPTPNKKYVDWSWSLVKDKGSEWKIVNQGY